MNPPNLYSFSVNVLVKSFARFVAIVVLFTCTVTPFAGAQESGTIPPVETTKRKPAKPETARKIIEDVARKRTAFESQFAKAYGVESDSASKIRQMQATDSKTGRVQSIAIDAGQPSTGSQDFVGPELRFNEPQKEDRVAPREVPQIATQPVRTDSSGGSSPLSTESLIWWPTLVVSPLHPENQVESAGPDSLLHRALQNSPKIQAISNDPLVSDLQVIEQDAVFDPTFFARHLYDDRVDPVGNSLTTGGAAFLKDNIWSGEAGLRRKLRRGGEIDISQRLGFQNSNSRFFVPQDQGTATLAINYSQPLLKGRGLYINSAQIMIAQSAAGVSWDTFSADLQQEIESILASYWQLYYDRSIFLQKKRNVERGQKILNMLVAREGLDSLPSQIARAKSAVESRKTELANAFRDVRNAETNIRRLTGERNWLTYKDVELLPNQHFALGVVVVSTMQ